VFELEQVWNNREERLFLSSYKVENYLSLVVRQHGAVVLLGRSISGSGAKAGWSVFYVTVGCLEWLVDLLLGRRSIIQLRYVVLCRPWMND